MPLLRTSAAGLNALAQAGRLGTTLATQMAHQLNRSASASEVRSWDASLAALAADLEQADLEFFKRQWQRRRLPERRKLGCFERQLL